MEVTHETKLESHIPKSQKHTDNENNDNNEENDDNANIHFVNGDQSHENSELNGSVIDPDRLALFDPQSGAESIEINHQSIEEDNRYNNEETRDDQEPLLEEFDQEGSQHNDDEVNEEEKQRDPTRHVHVEGSNVNSSHEGEIDAEGYRIDQHQETEHFSHTREVRELSDHLEIVQQDSRCLKLEEVKTKETVRLATDEEMKALLGAAVFDGKDKIELGTETIVEGFTRVEQTHEETDAGGVTSRNVTVTETREKEELFNDPNKAPLPSLEGNAPSNADYKFQVQQTSGNGMPALTAPEELSKTAAQNQSSAPPDLVASVEPKNRDILRDDPDGNGTAKRKSDGKADTLPSSDKKNKNKDDSKEKVHRGGFFCKQKHNMSNKSHSPASTLDRDSSLEEPKKGWSLFGRKSSRKSKGDKKGNDSKSDHSELDKSAVNSLDRSLSRPKSPKEEIKPEEPVTSRISTSSNLEPPTPVKPTRRASVNSITSPALAAGYSVVVGIDLGATVSSYSYCFPHEAPDTAYTMRKPEGSDPGLPDPKYPTIVLLSPEGEFHSFGFTARNVYQSLDPADAVKWMYFDSFRKQLTSVLIQISTSVGDNGISGTLFTKVEEALEGTSNEPLVKASNGMSAPAAVLLEFALKFLSFEAMQDLSLRAGGGPVGKVRWVITAPSGWHTEARHWIRQVAYKVGLASADFPQQLLVMQEPQAAAVAVHQLQADTFRKEYEQQLQQLQLRQQKKAKRSDDDEEEQEQDEHVTEQQISDITLKHECTSVLVSSGGDEVSVSVYDIKQTSMTLIYQSLFSNCGGTGVNDAFVKLVYKIFGEEFLEDYRSKKPAGWADLLASFELYKRSLDPVKGNQLNVPLPFSLIDHHHKHFGYDVEVSIDKYGHGGDVVWTQQGMLRLYAPAWLELFKPVLDKIVEAVRQAFQNSKNKNIEYIWLVGGFSECLSLQNEIRNNFKQQKVIIPKETSHVSVKGAVEFGVNPVQINFTQSSDISTPSRTR